MSEIRILIDPPVNYWASPVAEIEAWRQKLEAMPDAPNVRREIELLDAALADRASGEGERLLKEWGLS